MRPPLQRRWLLRMVAIVLLVGLADALVVEFTRRPLPWAVIIPALIPLLTAVFVIIPMIRAEKQ
jgi:hypothetical protein